VSSLILIFKSLEQIKKSFKFSFFFYFRIITFFVQFWFLHCCLCKYTHITINHNHSNVKFVFEDFNSLHPTYKHCFLIKQAAAYHWNEKFLFFLEELSKRIELPFLILQLEIIAFCSMFSFNNLIRKIKCC